MAGFENKKHKDRTAEADTVKPNNNSILTINFKIFKEE